MARPKHLSLIGISGNCQSSCRRHIKQIFTTGTVLEEWFSPMTKILERCRFNDAPLNPDFPLASTAAAQRTESGLRFWAKNSQAKRLERWTSRLEFRKRHAM